MRDRRSEGEYGGSGRRRRRLITSRRRGRSPVYDDYDRRYRRPERARVRYRPARDAGYRYERELGTRGEYGEPDGYSPYGREFFRWATPVPGHGIYPEHHWGGGMIHGLEGAGWAPFGLIGFPAYGYEYAYRARRPQESPTYGRDADRALRRWATRHGYELGPPIRPTGRSRSRRPRRRRRTRRPGAGRRYDRGGR